MDINAYAVKAQEAVQAAASLAVARENPEVATAHLLHALLEQPEGPVPSVLKRLGVDTGQLQRATQAALDRLPAAHGAQQQPAVSRTLVGVLNDAEQRASQLGDEYTPTEHLLLAIAESADPAGGVLRNAGVAGDDLLTALRAVRGSQRVTSPT